MSRWSRRVSVCLCGIGESGNRGIGLSGIRGLLDWSEGFDLFWRGWGKRRYLKVR